MEDLFADEQGRQVLAESYYNLAVILILLDNLIPGEVREKMVTLHVRIMGGQNAVSNIHQICKLTKTTGFVPKWYTDDAQKKNSFLNEVSPTVNKDMVNQINFTAKMFSRLKVDKKIVEKVVLTLKDGDIYDMARNYPEPELRSFGLANQASLLYALLFFIPEFLFEESSKMREIVDKHFYDNWVVPLYLGYLVDLSFEWRLFDAANKAIRNTISPDHIKKIAKHHREVARNTVRKLYGEVLLEGYLSKVVVLKELESLMKLLRESNSSCRWLMLHRLSRNEELRDLVQ